MADINSYKVAEKTTGYIVLDGNEYPLNYDSERLAFIVQRLKDEELNRYPDSDSNELREVYSKVINVNTENLIAGHGSDEMLGMLISKYISQGKKILTLAPDFSMYDFYCSLNGGEMIKYQTEEDGQVNVSEFIKLGKEKEVDIVMFSNPNNPTGNIIRNDDIEIILEQFKDIPVVVDEAYVEFYGNSMVSMIDKYKNLIVTRTLSKAWGLANLRVGFLIANKELVSELTKYKVPYNVSAVSQVIAFNVLENENVEEHIEKILMWKDEFYTELENIQKESCIDIKFYKGNSNFIYGRCKEKTALLAELENKKIKIRNFNDDTFRITVGVPVQNKQVLDAIKKTCIYEEEF